MFNVIDVPLDERAVVLRHGIPVRVLGPGRTWLFGLGVSIARLSTAAPCADVAPEVRAILDPASYREIVLGRRERAIVSRNGRPFAFLRPGTHLVWVVDPSTEVEVHSIDAPMPELTEALVALVPRTEYVLVDVPQHARGLLFVGERYERDLAPGRHAFWTSPSGPVSVRVVDVRRQQVTLAGQELMTRDKVTIRLSLLVEYAVEDPVLSTFATVDVRDAIYGAVQLAARDYVASVTLDGLLEGRRAMTAYLASEVAPKARAIGVVVGELGVKDVVLPGEMKTLLNRVIEAEKEAAANVISRREEAAATRLRASSAKIFEEQPILMRLTELEALKDVAKSVGDLRIVVGDAGLERLIASGFADRAKVDSG